MKELQLHDKYLMHFFTQRTDGSKELKKKVNRYFHLLRCLHFVTEIEPKYTAEHFLDFWYRFIIQFNNVRTNHRN